MAVDDAGPEVAPLEKLRRERNDLHSRIGDGPPDPSWEYRHLSEALSREKHGRDGAQWRLDTARQSLQDLGPIGRRTHRTERRELERRVAGFETDIARHDTSVAERERQLAELTPSMLTRSSWEHTHAAEIQRTSSLDQQIDMTQRLELMASRSLDRGLERDYGIEL